MLEHQTVLDNAKATTLRERDTLRQQLTAELAKGDIDIDAITSNIVTEKLAEATGKFEEEKNALHGFLQSKIDRNLALEV